MMNIFPVINISGSQLCCIWQILAGCSQLKNVISNPVTMVMAQVPANFEMINGKMPG